jgi:phosphohistidine phosphatase
MTGAPNTEEDNDVTPRDTARRRTVLVMRHCKSDWDREDLADFDRPLSRRGLRDARRIGRLIRKAGFTPDAIIASPAARTRRTAEIIARRSGCEGAIVWEQSLYGTEADEYIAALRGATDRASRVMIIGHNPALEQLVGVLAGGKVRVPTGGVARLEVSGTAPWKKLAPGGCTLTWLLVPRLLRAFR